jgi:hypothetical protein
MNERNAGIPQKDLVPFFCGGDPRSYNLSSPPFQFDLVLKNKSPL